MPRLSTFTSHGIIGIVKTLPPEVLSINVPGDFDEGTTATINLVTKNIPDGTSLTYSVVPSTDFTSAGGSVTINNNTGSFTVTPTADLTTEGAETFSINVSGNVRGFSLTSSRTNLVINDTSTESYSIIPAVNNVDEGSSLTFNVTTAGLANGTTLYYTLSNSGDFASSSGSFTINSNAGSFSVTPTADSTTEGSETFTASLRTGSVSGTVVAVSSSVTINDTSLDPPTYSLTPVANNVNEGSSLTFNVTTTNVQDGTTLYWQVSNGSQFGTDKGSFTINSNAGSFSVTPTADNTTEGATTFIANLALVLGGTSIADSSSVTINDTSQDPTYDSITAPVSVNEGSTCTWTVNTDRVPDSSTVGYTITGIATDDLSAGSLTGSITITSDSGTAEVTLDNDLLTEGAETMTLTLAATDSNGYSTGGISSSVTVNDTSTTPPPTYAVSAAATNVNEGSTLTFTVTTTNVNNGTTLYWTATNGTELQASSGSFSINSSTGSFGVTPTADFTTESGTELFTVSIRTGSISGTVVAESDNITINDTSQTPAISSVAGPASVNEGSAATFTVTTANFPAGDTDLSWSFISPGNTSNAADFSVTSGTVTITNNTGTFSITPTADTTAEGSETFQISVQGVVEGAGLTQGSNKVTINDTSTPPVTWDRQATLSNPNIDTTSSSDRYGYGNAITDDYIIIGSDLEDSSGYSNQGVIYVYEIVNETTITLRHTLTNPNSTGTNQYWGQRIDANGDYIVVGDATGNRVHVYQISSLSGATISSADYTITDSTASSSFADSIAIDNGWIVVGDPGVNSSNGCAYVYNISTFSGSSVTSATHVLQNPYTNTGTADRMGQSVDIHKDQIAVSMSGYNESANQLGRLMLYNKSNFSATNITTPDYYYDPPTDQAYFGGIDGFRVAINQDAGLAAVCHQFYDAGAGILQGRVYVVDFNGNLERILESPDAGADDRYGTACAFNPSGDQLFVTMQKSSQATYVYNTSTILAGLPSAPLTSADYKKISGNNSPFSVSANDTRFIVGAQSSTILPQVFYKYY
jgi:hypothetical protein